MNESSERKKGAILSYVTIGINTLIQLLYVPFLIRRLGQSEYGLYSLVASIIGYLTIMDFGFGNAIIVYTSKYKAQNKLKEEKKLHGMFNLIFKIVGIIAALLGLLLFLNVNNLFGNTMTSIEIHKMKIMMLILSFNLMITFSFNIYSCIITAYEKFVFQKIISIIGLLLKPLIMLPLLFLGFKSIAMCFIITIVNIIVLISNYVYCRKKLKKKPKYIGFDKVLLKTILGYSIWIFLSVIVDKINWSLDNFLLGALSGTVSVSIYSLSSQINQMYIMFSTAISGVLLPYSSKMVAKKYSDKKLTEFVTKTGRIQLYIVGLIISGFIIFGKDFILLWVGKKFSDSYGISIALMLPMIIPLIQNSGAAIVQAKNKFKFVTLVLIGTSILNIVISIPLIKLYGALGAAFGTAIALLLGNGIIKNIYYHRVIKLDMIFFAKKIAPIAISITILTFAFNMIKHYCININHWNELIICILIYSFIYCIISILLMNNYEKNLINNIINKIRRKRYDKN